MAQTDLTIAGVGGQGSILAGVILGSAAVTFDGKYATQTQAYSSELRGGFAAAWVIVSDEPIEFPRVTQLGILVAQAQDSINRFGEVLSSTTPGCGPESRPRVRLMNWLRRKNIAASC
jgi:2-oxoglutarate ferredoxin oxidoreductase subunit gamma